MKENISNSEKLKKNKKVSKILFIIPFLTMLNRGIERSGFNLAKALKFYVDQVSILCWSTFGEKRKNIGNGINVIPVKLPKYFSSYFASLGYLIYLLLNKPDVVVIFYAGHGEAWPIRLARKFINFHLSFIAGYPIETVPHRFQEFKTLGIESLLDSIIVKSPAMKKGVEIFFNRPVQIITNGIDTDYFKKSKGMNTVGLKHELGISPDSIVLLTVAALEKRKGIHYVINSLERLQTENISNVNYIILGDGNHRQYFEKLIKESSVGHRIYLIGSVKDVRPYYATSDLFVLLSYGDGFPNSLLEAWAMELPVVVSNHPPYPEITNSKNAIKLSLDDEDGLDDLIKELVENKYRFRKTGIKNRTFLNANYSWQNIAAKYIENFKV
jgi:glycosyltransferase involved in cell wall biosynthesis